MIDLLEVMATLEAWLAAAPEGPLALGGAPAKAAIKALAEGWSSTILRALAAKPLSLTELDRLIGAFNYPSLERRLAAMRLAGQIEASPGDGRGTPYAVTAWLRQGVAPLAAAIHWERWLAALIDADPGGLELGGDTALARTVLDGLHRALFGFDAESARTTQPADPS